MNGRVVVLSLAILSFLWVTAVAAQDATVSFRSGGVGLDAREEVVKGFSLKLVFSTTKGAYMAKVRVRITDATTGAEVLNEMSAGPWFFVNLPDGFYDVTASSSMGAPIVQKGVRAASGRMSVVLFQWPEEMVQMSIEPKLDMK